MDERRANFINLISQTLQKAAPGSEVVLRGSLAIGKADLYSDIDLEWRLKGISFVYALSPVEAILNDVTEIASFRSDPDYKNSDSRRLLFLRFSEMPLFWRVDLECIAITPIPQSQIAYLQGLDMPWSEAESVLMNCIAAVKWLRRGQPAAAQDLLDRALFKVGIVNPVDLENVEAISTVCHKAAELDPSRIPLANAILDLIGSKERL